MPEEFNISEKTTDRAERAADVAREYLQRIVAGRGPFPSSAIDMQAEISRVIGEAPIDDTIYDLSEIAAELWLAQDLHIPIAAVNVPEVGLVPVVDSELTGRRMGLRYELGLFRRRRAFLRSSEVDRISYVAPDQVVGGVFSGLKRFLAHRIEGFNFWRDSREEQNGDDPPPPTGSSVGNGPPPPGSAANAVGFYIQLNCMNHHLAAYASPAYALTWRNFGSLTTPALGILPPGAWIFGAKGGLSPSMLTDLTPVHIPTNFTPTTRCF